MNVIRLVEDRVRESRLTVLPDGKGRKLLEQSLPM